MEEILKKIISQRNFKIKKTSESLANLEESLFEAEQRGNTRKINALKIIINRIKNKKADRY